MRTVQRTCFEIFIIGIVGLALGVAANGVRARGSISPTKDYFAKGASRATALPGSTPSASDSLAGTVEIVDAEKPGEDPAQIASTKVSEPGLKEHPRSESAAAEQPGAKHLQHEYQSIAFDEVVAVFNDPRTRQGMNLFVDARNDDHFKEGHIPGAVQCFPFELHRFIDEVLERANGVDKVIVYCNGGECEDSIFACRDLIAAGIPYESVYLYEGGWKEWASRDMPAVQD